MALTSILTSSDIWTLRKVLSKFLVILAIQPWSIYIEGLHLGFRFTEYRVFRWLRKVILANLSISNHLFFVSWLFRVSFVEFNNAGRVVSINHIAVNLSIITFLLLQLNLASLSLFIVFLLIFLLMTVIINLYFRNTTIKISI